LKAIHRHLFQDIYEWAGHTRDERVKLSDGTIATEPVLRKVGGQPFMKGPLIAGNLKRITGRLRDENYLRCLSREEFSHRAATLMVELNGMHPFREGNGRTQRVFVVELAREAGHKLDFSCVTRERMIQASIAGNEKNDPAMMQRLFNEISNPLRVAALNKSRNQPGIVTFLRTLGAVHIVASVLFGIAGVIKAMSAFVSLQESNSFTIFTVAEGALVCGALLLALASVTDHLDLIAYNLKPKLIESDRTTQPGDDKP
jgi:fido (protein-threonine AMPylation protein)